MYGRPRAALIAVVLCLVAAGAEAVVPASASQYQRELTRIVQQEFGLSAPVALHAAQIHQESSWRPDVDSRVGAQGLAQFMPRTSAWLVEVHPDLGGATPYSPRWAMRAMARYNRWHLDRVTGADDCHRWAFALSAYNGGLTWVRRDQALAREAGRDPAQWWCNVEHHTGRADWARRENRHYVDRILLDLAPAYLASGWGSVRVCKGVTDG